MKLTSIQAVIAKCVRDLGLKNTEIPANSIIEWCGEALEAVGAYAQFEKKEAFIEIEDYKGKLPCDHFETIRLLDGVFYNTNLIGDVEKNKFTNYDFKVDLNQITTAHRNCTVKIQYLAIPVDDCGLPMVPDEYSYMQAFFWKVAMHLSILGELKNKELSYQVCRNEYLKYVGQARAHANMPDLNMLERLKNNWLRLVPDPNQYSKLFSGLGKEEYLRRDGINL